MEIEKIFYLYGIVTIINNIRNILRKEKDDIVIDSEPFNKNFKDITLENANDALRNVDMEKLYKTSFFYMDCIFYIRYNIYIFRIEY